MTHFMRTASLAAFVVNLISVAVLAQSPTSGTAQNAPGVPPSTNDSANDSAPNVRGSIVTPKVFFVEPKDGATVAQNFTVKFGVTGMKIAPAGRIIPGAGHHHLIIDGTPIKKDQVVGTDATHLHFGKGQTETQLKLAPGHHTLTLQLADGAHRSYGDAMSSTINITVK